MGKVRVVYKPDKTVAVIHPAPKSKCLGETEDQWLKRIFDKCMQPFYDKKGQQINPLVGLSYDDIDSSQLPQTREYRDAWEGEKGKGILINQKKVQAKQAKEVKGEGLKNKLKNLGLNNGEIQILLKGTI